MAAGAPAHLVQSAHMHMQYTCSTHAVHLHLRMHVQYTCSTQCTWMRHAHAHAHACAHTYTYTYTHTCLPLEDLIAGHMRRQLVGCGERPVGVVLDA